MEFENLTLYCKPVLHLLSASLKNRFEIKMIIYIVKDVEKSELSRLLLVTHDNSVPYRFIASVFVRVLNLGSLYEKTCAVSSKRDLS